MNRLSGQSRVIDIVPSKPLRQSLPLSSEESSELSSEELSELSSELPGHVPAYWPLSDFEVPERVKVTVKVVSVVSTVSVVVMLKLAVPSLLFS